MTQDKFQIIIYKSYLAAQSGISVMIF